MKMKLQIQRLVIACLLFLVSFTGQAQWQGWHTISASGTTNVPVCIPEATPQMIIGNGVNVKNIYYSVSANPFSVIPGNFLSNVSVDAVSWFHGLPFSDLYVFGKNLNNQLYFNLGRFDNNSGQVTWPNNWTPLDGRTDVAPTVTSPDNTGNNIFLFIKGETDNQIYLNEYN